MRSRAARLTLSMLFVAVLGVTAYLFWLSETGARREMSSALEFDAAAHDATRTMIAARNAQQAYVAAGQGVEHWSQKVSDALGRSGSALTSLRQSAGSPGAREAIDAAAAILKDFTQLDRRIASFARGGQILMASDVIFADALELTDGMLASLEQARSAEARERQAAIAMFQRRQVFALASGAAAAVLVVLLLLPGGQEPERTGLSLATVSAPASGSRPAAAADLDLDTWNPPKRAAPTEPTPALAIPEPTAGPEPRPAVPENAVAPLPEPTPPAPPLPATDLSGLATLCTDLARVVDTRALPSLLDRAASVLDASGIILWIADPDGRELNPIVAHGYPAQLVNRLGTIPRDAENATAAAFRTALVQTVRADEVSNGAIAAPLVTPGGCVGVMAAEVRHEREGQDDALAAAAIVAAQLATLVGPPPSARQGREEAAHA